MNKPNINLINKNIQEAIRSGKLKMHSKKYFIARTALIAISIVIIAAALVYLISFVFFVLQTRGVWELSGFGFKGLMPFIISLPWLLLAAAFIFLIGLEFLVKKTTIAYRKPLVYSVSGLMLLVLLAGFGFTKFSLHEKLYNRAIDHNPPPIVGSFYKEFGEHPLHNAHPGMIADINSNGFIMTTHMGEIMNVVITADTIFIDKQELRIDDQVMVMGDNIDGVITAKAIKIRDGRGIRSFDKKPGSLRPPMHKPLN